MQLFLKLHLLLGIATFEANKCTFSNFTATKKCPVKCTNVFFFNFYPPSTIILFEIAPSCRRLLDLLPMYVSVYCNLHQHCYKGISAVTVAMKGLIPHVDSFCCLTVTERVIRIAKRSLLT